MKNKINAFVRLDKTKIVFLLVLYIIFSEIVKNDAEIYILEQSLELKLFLLSWAIVLMYNVSEVLIVISMLFFLFLGLLDVQTGLMTYVFLFYIFLKLFKVVTKNKWEL